MKTLVATSNLGKVKEILQIVGDRLGSLLCLQDLPDIGELPEDHDTFEANARQKAWTAAERTGLPCLADDSGLCVDALGGAPGVYSARYAGIHATAKENRAKLAAAMQGQTQRSARFVCVMVLVNPDTKEEIVARGECEGEIATEEQGNNGFGYDPLFLIPSKNKTMAELSSEEKNHYSHRGKAIEELLKKVLAISK